MSGEWRVYRLADDKWVVGQPIPASPGDYPWISMAYDRVYPTRQLAQADADQLNQQEDGS